MKTVKKLKAVPLKFLKTLNLDLGNSGGGLTLEALNNMSKAGTPLNTMRAIPF